MARLLVRLLILVFILAPNGLAFWLWTAAQQTDRTGAIVAEGLAKGFSVSEPFVAEGTLISPSDDAVESLEFHEPCLAFRTKVELCYTTTDSEGELEDRRTSLLDERHQVKDLAVDFGEAKAILDIQTLKSFYQAKFTDMENPPEYLKPDQIPTTTRDSHKKREHARIVLASDTKARYPQIQYLPCCLATAVTQGSVSLAFGAK